VISLQTDDGLLDGVGQYYGIRATDADHLRFSIGVPPHSLHGTYAFQHVDPDSGYRVTLDLVGDLTPDGTTGALAEYVDYNTQVLGPSSSATVAVSEPANERYYPVGSWEP